MSKSTIFCRLLRRRIPPTSLKYPAHPFNYTHSLPNPIFTSQITRNYSSNFGDLSENARVAAAERALDEIVTQAARERMREREERIKAGLSVADLDAGEEEDYLGVGPLIEKLEKKIAKDDPSKLNVYEEPTDSECESESDDEEAMNKRMDLFEKKFDMFEKLLDKFAKAGS